MEAIRKKEQHALDNAVAWLESIKAMLATLAETEGDDALQSIYDSPLSVQVRYSWHDIGAEAEDGEYCILLTTGGPALRIIGSLETKKPASAKLEYQDWGLPWTELRISQADEDALIYFASHFFA